MHAKMLPSRTSPVLSLERALLGARSMQFSGRDRLIADRLQREIIERLEFLNAVGLGYLSLER